MWLFSDWSGTRNRIFGFPDSAEKWVEVKLNKGFLHFLPNFWHIWWFFKVSLHPFHFEKNAKILSKNKENPCSTCLQPISTRLYQNPCERPVISGTRFPSVTSGGLRFCEAGLRGNELRKWKERTNVASSSAYCSRWRRSLPFSVELNRRSQNV